MIKKKYRIVYMNSDQLIRFIDYSSIWNAEERFAEVWADFNTIYIALFIGPKKAISMSEFESKPIRELERKPIDMGIPS